MGKLSALLNIGEWFAKRSAARAAAGAAEGAAAGTAAGGAGLLGKIAAPLGSAAKWGAIVGAPIALIGAGTSIVKNGWKDTITGVGEWLGLGASDISTTTVVGQTENMLYKMIAMLARGLKLLGVKGGIPEAMMDFANQGIVGAKNPEANGGWGPNGPGGSDLGSHGPGLGTAAVAAPLLAAGGAAGYTAYKGFKGRGGPGGGGNTPPTTPDAPDGGGRPSGGERPGANSSPREAAESEWKKVTGKKVASEAAEEGVEAVARGAGRFGRLGKVLVFGGAGAVGLGLIGGEEAEAATLTSGAARGGATVTGGGAGALQSIGADAAGFGLSILGGKAAAETVAHAAAPVAAKLGLSTIAKSIPGVSAIHAAGETILNVGGDVLRGDFKKAGLNLISGVGETVAGLGGAATYWTLGTAWREGVRGVGAQMLGEENTIDHSLAVQVGGGVGSWLKEQFFGATSGTPSTAAQPSYRRDNTGPAFAF